MSHFRGLSALEINLHVETFGRRNGRRSRFRFPTGKLPFLVTTDASLSLANFRRPFLLYQCSSFAVMRPIFGCLGRGSLSLPASRSHRRYGRPLRERIAIPSDPSRPPKTSESQKRPVTGRRLREAARRSGPDAARIGHLALRGRRSRRKTAEIEAAHTFGGGYIRRGKSHRAQHGNLLRREARAAIGQLRTRTRTTRGATDGAGRPIEGTNEMRTRMLAE